MLLTDDHLVLNMGKDKDMVNWYFRNLVLGEFAPFPQDHYMKAALRESGVRAFWLNV